MAFQARYGVAANGVAGLKNIVCPMVLGFDNGLVKPPPPVSPGHQADANWPPRPDFGPLTSTGARQKLFGAFGFEAAPVAGNRENIRIEGDWEARNIIRVAVPQLRRVPGAPASAMVRAGSVRSIVFIANDPGFFWGGHYAARADGMHFEIARLNLSASSALRNAHGQIMKGSVRLCLCCACGEECCTLNAKRLAQHWCACKLKVR